MAQRKCSADLILYDQENPSNREIKQPGEDVGYSATSPIHYKISPDEKGGVPSSHDLPNQHHDDANPSSSRVVPDSMKDNFQDSLTYTDGGQHINAALFQQDVSHLLNPLFSVMEDLEGASDIAALSSLNLIFKAQGISFSSGGDPSRNDLYAKAKISSGAINELGEIEIILEFGFSEVFDTQKGRKDFAFALRVILTHEMHHRAQLERIRASGNLSEAMQEWLRDSEDYEKYLEKPHEISAHASAALTEMLGSGLSRAQIIDFLRSRKGWVSLDSYSDSFYKYHWAFEGGSPTFRRFLSNLHNLLGLQKIAAAIGPGSLPQGIRFQIRKTSFGKGGWKVIALGADEKPVAVLSMAKPLDVGPCLGAYEVQNSWSDIKGLGPLLYDIALEIAGDSGVMSDRREVSPDAHRVWDYYLNSRPDVRWEQLDSFVGSLNSDPEDDCKNSSAGVAWRESALSKVYYKKTHNVLQELRSLGLIEEGSVKSAALISEIFQNCTEDLVGKAKGVAYTRKFIRPNGLSVWTATGSKGESYTIKVQPSPKAPGTTKALEKLPILVSCTCPFFQWQGPEHWATQNGYLYGKPAGSASKPENKDPKGGHWACKHVLAVLQTVRKQKLASLSGFSWDGYLLPLSQKIAKVLDSAWLADVKKAWLLKSAVPAIYDSQDSLTHLQGVLDWVDALSEDLLFQRGFYHVPQKDGLQSTPQKIKAKAVSELRAVRKGLLEGLAWVSEGAESMTPGTPAYTKSGGQIYAFYAAKDPKSPLRAFYASCREVTKETIEKVSGIFTRKFLRSLSEAVNKYSPIAPLDFGTKVLEYDIGRVKVLYRDILPSNEGPLGTIPVDSEETLRHPPAEEYAPYLVKAKALLERRGLGFLWYGTLRILSENSGGTNPHGDNFGVGASYHPREDDISLFEGAHPGITRLILHEVGHRYYFRFMDSGDRGKFDSYFNSVPATSTYGSTVSAEDFAEVFADYAMGENLSRDQIERLKVFLGRTSKSASKTPTVLRPLGWNATSEEGHAFLKSLEGPAFVFRGITETEYSATIGSGKPIWSRGDYSHSSEGTNFATSAEDAESYVNFGRDDPRKTGRSNYLVRVRKTPEMILGRDGYVKSHNPVDAEAVWEMLPVEGEIQIRRLK